MTPNIMDRLGDDVYEFTFNGSNYKVSPKEDLPINQDNLSEEFVRQPSLYGYYAILKAKADATLKLAKVELEEEESRASDKIRAQFDAENKKTTEGMINSKVVINPDVMIAKRKLVDAQSAYAMLDALEGALKMRADMLVRLGSLQQAEWNQTGMHTKKTNPSEAMRNALANTKKQEDTEFDIPNIG